MAPYRNHVEARSSRAPARQYVAESHDHKADAPSRAESRSAAKHTAGPWTFDEVRTSCGRAFRIGSGEMLVAGKGCCIIYDDYPGRPDNERAANARLIAAAPELLEFAKWVADRGGDNNCMDIFKRARSLIAKAEGGAS